VTVVAERVVLPPAAAKAARRLRVSIICRQLVVGGAERQLAALLSGLSREHADVQLLLFYEGGGMSAEIAGLPYLEVVHLRKSGRWDLGFLLRAYRAVRAFEPSIVYGYQSVAAEVASALGWATGARVVWGVRASNMDHASYGWLSRAAFRVGALMSRSADLIIFNSDRGAAHFAAHGYTPAGAVVIANGIDTERFRPDAAAGRAWRAANGVRPNAVVIGCAARLDPMKDLGTFLQAAAQVRTCHPDTVFVIAGSGPPAHEAQLRAQAESLGFGERLIWAGATADMTVLMNALDIACSTSAFGEGFSNVIGEAMACGRPCVATDVGDAARIVGDAGIVVEIAIGPDGRCALGERSRRRVETLFGLETMQRRTFDTLRGLVQQCA
jgi:glycosyltransferase involved in cell wall biosynthesis